jgi:hypothetical protein
MKRVLLGLLLVGCAHQKPAQKVEMDPIVFQAQPQGGVAVVDVSSLFADAGAAFGEARYADAARLYDRIALEYPDSRFVDPSLYNAGLALENLGDPAAAAERYRKLVARNGKDALDGLYRLGGVNAAQKNWAAAAETYATILGRKDLTLSDRVEALARRAEAQFGLRDLGAAERTIREQGELVRANEAVERLDTDFFVGMAAYYLGEIAHEQYRALPVRLPEKQLAIDLENKARMLLVAQQRYIDAMRANNVEWATAAGFQIGSLYREFYDDLVGAPVPPQLTGEARDVYLEEVRKQVRGLLQKAVAVHEKNLLMAERNGVKNDWVRRSNDQMEQLRRLLVPGATAAPPPAQSPETPPPLPKPTEHTTPRVVM